MLESTKKLRCFSWHTGLEENPVTAQSIMHHQDLVMKQHHQPGREFPRKHKGNIPYIYIHVYIIMMYTCIHYSELTPSAFQLPITSSTVPQLYIIFNYLQCMYIQYIYSFPNCFPKLLSLTHHVNFLCGRKPENTKKLFLFCYTIQGMNILGNKNHTKLLFPKPEHKE